MKKMLCLLLLLVSLIGYSQNNHIVKTEDGRRVLLKADFTWEYIDLEKPKTNKITTIAKTDIDDGCNLPKDFKEPKLSSKIQSQLKKGRATIKHIKEKVAKDYGCTVADVRLLSASEKKTIGTYTFCANGKKVYYKRNGHKIVEKGKLF
ncbi:DUF3157 family protein [Jejuia pallidilutea]|uniref:DUF3157 family protein n=1 Tax=Jejuia pallidilutea TaxID=504487 RepID=A0A090VYG4_9FLAO|nr:DUF3157 family protein [Jejuia pallidilutea]GAL68289.1 hypothetical protein JCM19301_229 [Jejuia pallidilutea]GAL70234.1 hypothetical protein JCM19302_2809 [Jejuia pallidilutea]GAL88821.1 hypothetical protein JCM19538_1810 [Jejuia pallidilutea]